MISSNLFLLVVGFLLFLNIIILIIILRSRNKLMLNDDDNEFVKYNLEKAKTIIQKDRINGIKQFWNMLEFVLNRKKYKGDLDEKIESAQNQFEDFMELKAQRQWSLDLTNDAYIKEEQITHFMGILEKEMKKLGVRLPARLVQFGQE